MCFLNGFFDAFEFDQIFPANERQLVMVGPSPPVPDELVNSLEMDNGEPILRMGHHPYIFQKAATYSGGDNSPSRTMDSQEMLSPTSSHGTASTQSRNSMNFQQTFSPDYLNSPEENRQYSLTSGTNYSIEGVKPPPSYNNYSMYHASPCLPDYEEQLQPPPIKMSDSRQHFADHELILPPGVPTSDLPATSNHCALAIDRQQQAYPIQGTRNTNISAHIRGTATNQPLDSRQASAQYPSPVTPSNDQNFQQITPAKLVKPAIQTNSTRTKQKDYIPREVAPKLSVSKQQAPGEPRPRCQLCNREYRHPKHLARHLKTHTGIRPFSCSICDARFVRSDIRNRHYQRCLSNNSGSKLVSARQKSSTKSKDNKNWPGNGEERNPTLVREKPGTGTAQPPIRVSNLYSYGQLYELSNPRVATYK